jgi:hypothetical protein
MGRALRCAVACAVWLSAAGAEEECASGACGGLGGWQPWDGAGEAAALGEVLASDKEGAAACRTAVRAVRPARLVSYAEALSMLASQRVARDAPAPPATDAAERVLVALNGASAGVLFEVSGAAAKEGCLGSLARAAVLVNPARPAAAAGDTQVAEPKRLLSNTGRPVRGWADVQRSDFILHVLLDREAWVWPGLEVGFSWRVAGTKVTTVSLAPRVLLAEDVLSAEEAEAVIRTGSRRLYRSPEKHYSDDPAFDNYRTSETGSLDDAEPAARALRRRCWQVMRLESLGMVETLQLLYYSGPGRWYKEHYDTFHHIAPLDAAEDDEAFLGASRKLAHWALEMRYALSLAEAEAAAAAAAASSTGDAAAELLAAAAQLHLQPASAWYPRLRSPAFVRALGLAEALRGAEVDTAETHVSWLRGAFCGARRDDDGDACVQAAAEALDALLERSPPIAPARIERNRHVTMLPYLRGVPEGGETVFPYANGPSLYGMAADVVRREGMAECSKGIFVPPVARGAAVFYHVLPDGRSKDRLSMHGGCPPARGSDKWAINVFSWSLDAEQGASRLRDD